jgi:hypothetical protein
VRFDPEDIAEPAADLSYAPNKLHGDEIQAADGTTLHERQPREWLGRSQVEALIRRSPAINLLLVDDTVDYPPRVYRVAGDAMRSWTRRLSTLCISDNGELDPAIGWSLDACLWATDNGPNVVVFRVDC